MRSVTAFDRIVDQAKLVDGVVAKIRIGACKALAAIALIALGKQDGLVTIQVAYVRHSGPLT